MVVLLHVGVIYGFSLTYICVQDIIRIFSDMKVLFRILHKKISTVILYLAV